MMHQVMSVFEQILSNGGNWIVFAAAIVEAIPFLGTFVPGHSTIMLAGFFARLGALNIWTLMLLASLGAMLGDGIGYLLGRHYGEGFLRRSSKYFGIKEEHILKAKLIMAEHTGKALIFGRYNPVTRSLTPFMAGASKIHIQKFWLWDSIGAITWAILSVLIGYVFGASYEVVSSYIGRFMFVALVLIVGIVASYYFVNKRKHIFNHSHFYLLAANVVCIYIFFKAMQDIFTKNSWFANVDVWTGFKVFDYVTPALTQCMTIISTVVSPESLTVLALLIILFLSKQRLWEGVAVIALGVGGGAVLVPILKELVGRTRPGFALIETHGFSFPSGHAFISTVFALAITYCYFHYSENMRLRNLLSWSLGLMVIAVSASRIYLNAHWLSDVIAGISLGVIYMTFIVIGVRWLMATFGKKES